MPADHMVIWEAYVFDEAERERLLVLSHRFQPGQVSKSLLDALYDISDEDIEQELERKGIRHAQDANIYAQYRRDEMRIQRKNGRHDWLARMSQWGYPPGWIASKGA